MKAPIAILTADEHARNTAPRCRNDAYMETLRRKLMWVKQSIPEGAWWLSGGDLFQSWKAAQETEIMMIDVLRGETFIAVPGNHEIPYHDMDRLHTSSFGVLQAAGVIKNNELLSHIDILPVHAPFYSGLDVLINHDVRVAILHGMVWPDKPPMPGMEGMAAQDVLAMFPEFDVILTGHNHQTFVVEQDGRILVNPGSIMRSAIDQIDHKPCFFILYDDKTVEQVFIPIEDDVFAEDVYQKQHDHADRLQAFLERVQDTEGFSESFEKNLDVYCQRTSVGEEVRKEISGALEGK